MASRTPSRSNSYPTMRFSTLALFIVLPAAAYAAVCPPQQLSVEQLSVEHKAICAGPDDYCDMSVPCCGYTHCMWNVCPSASDLSLANRDVRYASKCAMFRFWSEIRVRGGNIHVHDASNQILIVFLWWKSGGERFLAKSRRNIVLNLHNKPQIVIEWRAAHSA